MINNTGWGHRETDKAKCLREFHFYLDSNGDHYKLGCTGFFRAQAVDIMPKNFYFAYYVMEAIRKKIQIESNKIVEMGNYTHFVTTLVATRND